MEAGLLVYCTYEVSKIEDDETKLEVTMYFKERTNKRKCLKIIS